MASLKGQPTTAPFFQKVVLGEAMGVPLTYDAALKAMHKDFEGITPSHLIGLHGLRRGGATDLSKRASREHLKRIGGWRSDACECYLELSTAEQASLATALLS